MALTGRDAPGSIHMASLGKRPLSIVLADPPRTKILEVSITFQREAGRKSPWVEGASDKLCFAFGPALSTSSIDHVLQGMTRELNVFKTRLCSHSHS